MVEFMKQDNSGDWEYKIIRGILGAFRSEERMRRALENEAQASWELAMKFDDERMLLRRPRSASRQDATLDPGISPYRTDYGGKSVFLVVGLLTFIAGVVAFALTYFAAGEKLFGDSNIIMIGVLAIMIILGLVVVSLKLRR